LEKLGDIQEIFSFRDAAFLSETHLLLIDEAANLWEVDLCADASWKTPRKIIRGGTLLRPVAKALGQSLNFWMKPAAGAYPRLALCPEKQLVIVNSHDLVCVAYSLDQAGKPELVCCAWGHYYPTFEFSTGGDFLIVNSAEEIIAFDPATWEFLEVEGQFKASVFHPSKTQLLVLKENNELGWFNFSKGSLQPQYLALGTLQDLGPDVSLGINTQGNECVVLSKYDGAQLWCALDPFEEIDPKAQQFNSRTAARKNKCWLAHYREDDTLDILNVDSKEFLLASFPAKTLIRFSPSGQYAATIAFEVFSENPYLVKPQLPSGKVSIWRL